MFDSDPEQEFRESAQKMRAQFDAIETVERNPSGERGHSAGLATAHSDGHEAI